MAMWVLVHYAASQLLGVGAQSFSLSRSTPLKSTYPLQGSTINELNIELLDQNGDNVDTQGEGYSCTIVIEYDME
jgi:hypothetical protein